MNTAVSFTNTLYQKLPDNLTFPVVNFGTTSVYLASGLGGVTTRNGMLAELCSALAESSFLQAPTSSTRRRRGS